MKKKLILGMFFTPIIANAYINEDNEYEPNPLAKEIVIYDSGDSPNQNNDSKELVNLKILKSRMKTSLKISNNLRTKTYSNLKFNISSEQRMGGKTLSLVDTKKKVVFDFTIIENPTDTLESFDMIETNKYYSSITNEFLRVINKGGKVYYAIYKVSNSSDTEYVEELSSLYEDIIDSIY